MSPNHDPLLHNLNLRLNTIMGIKKYQETKKIMADYDLQNKEDAVRPVKDTINIRVP